jgi:hypothetical protein
MKAEELKNSGEGESLTTERAFLETEGSEFEN